MRRIFNIITLSAAVIITLTACKKDDTIYYNNVTMGNIDGESIISDQGNIFDIKETPFEINFNEYKYGRVMLACDVLTQTAENRYDIRLLAMSSVLTKDIVNSSTITDPESELAVEDAIIIKEWWYSGGYINMLVEFAHKSGSTTAHMINLVHEDGSKYTFSLRHNAQGEAPTSPSSAYISQTGYVSFPIARLIKENEAEIEIKWNSHKLLDSGAYSLYETERAKTKFTWKRTGYEHKIES